MICTPHQNRVRRAWRMRWMGHVECIEGKRSESWVLLGKPKEGYYLKDVGVDGRIMLKGM
jgi:hypothetical protein